MTVPSTGLFPRVAVLDNSDKIKIRIKDPVVVERLAMTHMAIAVQVRFPAWTPFIFFINDHCKYHRFTCSQLIN